MRHEKVIWKPVILFTFLTKLTISRKILHRFSFLTDSFILPRLRGVFVWGWAGCATAHVLNFLFFFFATPSSGKFGKSASPVCTTPKIFTTNATRKRGENIETRIYFLLDFRFYLRIYLTSFCTRCSVLSVCFVIS